MDKVDDEMTDKHTTLTELLGSRLCHDLISPIGAIGNGVELLELTGNVSSPEIELINSSVANANAKLRFFRVAYGLASANEGVASSDIRSIVQDYYQSSRISVEWQSLEGHDRRELKLAFLLLQCLEDALGAGGTITVTCSAERWEMNGRGAKLRFDKAKWSYLSDVTSALEMNASSVPFFLAQSTASTLNRTIQMSQGTETLALSY